jgi:hypothetical protein
MKTTEQTAELYFKQATISNILMLTDWLPQYNYTYGELIVCSLESLENLRDKMIPEYNEVVKSNQK